MLNVVKVKSQVLKILLSISNEYDCLDNLLNVEKNTLACFGEIFLVIDASFFIYSVGWFYKSIKVSWTFLDNPGAWTLTAKYRSSSGSYFNLS